MAYEPDPTQAHNGRGHDGAGRESLDALGDRLSEHGKQLKKSLGEATDATRAASHELAEASRSQLRSSPYLTLGMAFGLGWILGGGIPPRAFTFAAGLGSRVALSMLLKDLVAPETDLDLPDVD